MVFPDNFIWGAATSAYQVEGAAGAEGRGPSIWDEFCRRPGAIDGGITGETACDHYHRFGIDVDLMRDLGLQAYRFSIAWPRVLPHGRGRVNAAGLDFYDRLTDRLLAGGIIPLATLYHWDYPLALHRLGGWLHPESPDWFARYAEAVAARLSDRISRWITFNEPQIFVGLGYQEGSHAPGERLGRPQVLQIGHNVLLAHGKAVQALRSRAKSKPVIGYAPAVSPVAVPAAETGMDIQAARQAFFAPDRPFSMNNSWWADPVVFGRYPEDGLRLFAGDMPRISEGDLATIHQPLDFLGLNVYFGELYRAGPDGLPEKVPSQADQERSSFGWPVMPASLYWAAKFYSERYRLPLVISENGMALADEVSPDGRVHDPRRSAFLKAYLPQLQRACNDGIDVRGYFVWSLLDNFEWSAGYSQRFGIVHVDFATQERIIKDSGLWYKKMIAAKGSIL